MAWPLEVAPGWGTEAPQNGQSITRRTSSASRASRRASSMPKPSRCTVRTDSPVAPATARTSWAWVKGGSSRGDGATGPHGRTPGGPPRCGDGDAKTVGEGLTMASERAAAGSAPGQEPVLLQPGALGIQRLAPDVEGPEHRPEHRPEVGVPAAVGAGLDVAGPEDRHTAERRQLDLLAVDRPRAPG